MATITNLYRNPSFETNLTDWTAKTGATITQDTDHATAGTHAIKVVTAGTHYNTGVITPFSDATLLPAVQGDVLTISADIFGDVPLRVRVVESRVGQTYITEQQDTPVDSATVGRHVFTVAVQNAATEYVYVGYETTLNQAGTFWLDGMLVVKGDPYSDYFDGDSPNAVWTGTPHASTSVLTIPEEPIYSDPIVVTASDPLTAITAGDPLVPIG